MITPIFIPMSHSGGCGGSIPPFELYRLISCVLLFLLGAEITGLYGLSLFGGFIAFIICFYIGWILFPIVVLAFLIMCVIAIIQIKREEREENK